MPGSGITPERLHAAQPDAAGLRGGVTCDQYRDEMRRQLEVYLYQEHPSARGLGISDGPSKGLTASDANTREVIRRESGSRERRKPRDFSPQQVSIISRDETRFFTGRGARARSSTPDSDVQSRHSAIGRSSRAMAGVASSSPSRWDAPGGLFDIGSRRCQSRGQSQEYQTRYSENVNGTSLPGAAKDTKQNEDICSSPSSVQRPPRVGPPQFPPASPWKKTSERGKRHIEPHSTTTSKATKEELRYFIGSEEASSNTPRRELGVRTARPRMIIHSPGTESAAPVTLFTPRDAPSAPAQTVRREFSAEKVPQSPPAKAALASNASSPAPSRSSSQSSLRGETRYPQLGSNSKVPARLSGLWSIGSNSKVSSYMPGSQDSSAAKRGRPRASPSKRNVVGQDLFQRGLRN